MRGAPRMVLALGLAGAALLGSIGVSYALNPNTSSVPPEPVGWWLATLAFIGGIALAVTAFWQKRAEGFVHLAFVVVVAFLSAGWIAASVLGILVTRSGAPRIPIALHWIGLTVSTTLFLLALAEATRSLLELPGRETRETSPLPAPRHPE